MHGLRSRATALPLSKPLAEHCPSPAAPLLQPLRAVHPPNAPGREPWALGGWMVSPPGTTSRHLMMGTLASMTCAVPPVVPSAPSAPSRSSSRARSAVRSRRPYPAPGVSSSGPPARRTTMSRSLPGRAKPLACGQEAAGSDGIRAGGGAGAPCVRGLRGGGGAGAWERGARDRQPAELACDPNSTVCELGQSSRAARATVSTARHTSAEIQGGQGG